MPSETVLCAHCGKYLSCRCKHKHRRIATQPYIAPPPTLPSNLLQIGVDSNDIDNNDGSVLNNEEYSRNYSIPPADNPQSNNSDELLSHKAFGNALRSCWSKVADIRDDASDSDLEELPYSVLEDEHEPGYIDWATIEANSGLSAWDQLGESYEWDAAEIAEHLSAYDLAICKAFAYKRALTSQTRQLMFQGHLLGGN
ncbi:hypothetical protein PILCRDRAFT_1994 [Piloderma croceum F 1598]|uniref:Uncharacterized protein n=1 Tax=Piloderma croceum (strain F 1598) TaxID=765440 RepID=A0A0C3GGA9_PILCF|nr:hypothetical protein PILCRDRAFT_1994 [Piloderma croceum F 1598]